MRGLGPAPREASDKQGTPGGDSPLGSIMRTCSDIWSTQVLPQKLPHFTRWIYCRYCYIHPTRGCQLHPSGQLKEPQPEPESWATCSSIILILFVNVKQQVNVQICWEEPSVFFDVNLQIWLQSKTNDFNTDVLNGWNGFSVHGLRDGCPIGWVKSSLRAKKVWPPLDWGMQTVCCNKRVKGRATVLVGNDFPLYLSHWGKRLPLIY